MLLIECPWCGPRAESEFSCGGEADIVRPVNSEKMSDREWGEYVFMRTNTRGVHREQWMHAQGCRRWFMATRDTVTYQIQSYEKFPQPLAEAAPADTKSTAPERTAK
ncbi:MULTISPECIES: sarcosine oxidase subunit delta [Burkholderiaceae]|uniref:sarcosine oxidase subunit delta n=1 Tax=Burkholderiaceae TaxID=119060 RepID=UPI0026E02AE3|nr:MULTISPECIES: sarcosine oxidase subunit delta [Burkholderiaceae]MDO5947614.1 sarcosine oxidase subunit delta [Burkholderia cepacia]MDS0807079.1 sarcosine oxidase subunit delta [Burkholderia cenocepacia]